MNAAITKEVQQGVLTYNDCLTLSFFAAILSALSPHVKVGSRRPRKGEKSPLSTVVFFRPQFFIRTVLIRAKFMMVGCFRETLRSLARSFAGTTNLIQSAAHNFVVMVSGKFTLQRNTAMSQNKSAQPAPDAYGVLRVNPDQKPPKGFKQLCNSCRFDKFSGAYRYCPNCGADADSHCQYVAIKGGV